jgi:S4 domain protein YaaA
MEIVKIDSEYITLTQFLKMINVVSSGGEAKFFLLENDVFLNNELENRRNKKIYVNDQLIILDKAYKIK